MPHQQDYDATDAASYLWKTDKGTELLGVVNYLANKGVNAFSFLTFSLSGDDKNVFPHLLKVDIPTYNGYNDAQQWNLGVHHDRFDVSRLSQWERIFEYADARGMYLHFKTQETENDGLMDGGDTDRERKLYYRELIARFGHHIALNWNTGEENVLTTQQKRDMAAYLHATDPYEHNTVMHTYPGQYDRYASLTGSQSEYTGASLQTSNRTYNGLFNLTRTWVTNSRTSGKKWVVAVDEPGNASIGIHSDPNDLDLVRKKVLWPVLLAGGAGVQYYYGYQSGCGDLNCQDHRSRDDKYQEAGYAISFVEDHLQPYMPNLTNANNITSSNEDYVATNGSNAIIVYLPNGGSTDITLTPTYNDWSVDWYNPKTNEYFAVDTIVNNGNIAAPDNGDWVALLTADCAPVGSPCDDGNPNSTLDTINIDCQCVGNKEGNLTRPFSSDGNVIFEGINNEIKE